MRKTVAILPFAAMLLVAAAPQDAGADPARQQPGPADESEDDRAPDMDDMARDAALQPLVDVNIKKREINPLLVAAADDPYSLMGIHHCRDIEFALMRLDDVLGPDIDEVDPMTIGQKRRKAAGEMAKGLVGGLIPFRGMVREITGAGDAQRRYHAAWEAGLMRRAFLKGYGKAIRCNAPAAPLRGIVTVEAAASR